MEYLVNSYNPSVQLIPETNTSQIYWLVSDNLLAAYALKDYSHSVSTEIDNKLKSEAIKYNLPVDSNGLPISYKHEALIGDVLPPIFRNSSEQNGYSLSGDSNFFLVTEVNNYTQMTDWTNYADLLALRGMSLFNRGNISGAIDCYKALFTDNMWDGNGFTDDQFLNPSSQSYHIYQTYKLGLALVLSHDLKFMNISIDNRMANIIAACQQDNGGVITGYMVNESSTILSGLANTETTSIIAIADPTTATSWTSPNPTPTVPELHWLIILPLFASILIALILSGTKRKPKVCLYFLRLLYHWLTLSKVCFILLLVVHYE